MRYGYPVQMGPLPPFDIFAPHYMQMHQLPSWQGHYLHPQSQQQQQQQQQPYAIPGLPNVVPDYPLISHLSNTVPPTVQHGVNDNLDCVNTFQFPPGLDGQNDSDSDTFPEVCKLPEQPEEKSTKVFLEKDTRAEAGPVRLRGRHNKLTAKKSDELKTKKSQEEEESTSVSIHDGPQPPMTPIIGNKIWTPQTVDADLLSKGSSSQEEGKQKVLIQCNQLYVWQLFADDIMYEVCIQFISLSTDSSQEGRPMLGEITNSTLPDLTVGKLQ